MTVNNIMLYIYLSNAATFVPQNSHAISLSSWAEANSEFYYISEARFSEFTSSET